MLLNRWARTAAWLTLGGWFFGFSSSARAESPTDFPYIVERIPEEWLPQSSVIAITQTHDGYLWLGTLNGLVRFDGLRGVVFTEWNAPGLKSSQIICLFEDSRSNLWVGTQTAGIVTIKPDGSIQSVRSGDSNSGERLASVCESTDGTVWLNTLGGEVAMFQNGRIGVLNAKARPVIADKSGLLWLGVWLDGNQHLMGIASVSNSATFVLKSDVPVQKLDFLLASRKGGFWCLADDRVQKWADGRVERDLGHYPWAGVSVNTACEDNEGNLVVGTQGAGVFWFDAQGNAVQISGAQGLSHGTVLSLCVDREGDLWVGTDGGGLNRVRHKYFRVQEGSQGMTIQSVSSDADGGLWYANFGGKLNHWKPGFLKQYGVAEGLLDPNVRTVLSEGSNVWVGTTFGGLFSLNGDTFRQALGQPGGVNPSISALYRDRSGKIWAGTQAGLANWDGQAWKIFTTRDGLSENDVRAIAEDANGNLFIGTAGGGLTRLQNGHFAQVRPAKGLSSNQGILALYIDDTGVLWAGTSGGLARYQGMMWTLFSDSTPDHVLGNSVSYVIEDGQGYLWIGSNAGLMRVLKKALNDFAAGTLPAVPCRVYGKADGLPTRECTQGSQPAACRTGDGTLWFATIKGLVSVNPSHLTLNPYTPPVRIESVLIDGKEQITNALCPGQLQAVTVPAGKEHLEIQYTSLNLGAPDRGQFRYRLEGHETKWTDADGKSRVARYPNLPPGRYRFHLIAANEDGAWNTTGVELAVTVLPPFWRTWWFLGMNSAMLLAVLVLMVRYVSTQKLHRQLATLRQREALEKERARIARDLHDQLGANLTQVSMLGEMAESDKHLPEEVASHARQISQTACETTRALDEIVWAINPLNDTLEGLVTYICKYAQDYFAMAGLSYRLDVPHQLPIAGIPPELRHNVFLAFKEAVHNVVKHAQASQVLIRLVLQDAGFAIEIQDDGRGPGAPDENSGRNGLRNMRKRMEDVGGRFSITPAPSSGTLVRLTAPLDLSGTQ